MFDAKIVLDIKVKHEMIWIKFSNSSPQIHHLYCLLINRVLMHLACLQMPHLKNHPNLLSLLYLIHRHPHIHSFHDKEFNF